MSDQAQPPVSMPAKLKWNVPRGALIVALLCFLMPFVSFSCNGNKIVSLSGYQLVTGTQIQAEDQAQKLNPEPMMVLALVLGLVALLLALKVLSNQGMVLVGVAAAIAAVCGIHYKGKTEQDVLSHAGAVVQVNWEPAFWVLIIAYIIAAIWCLGAWKAVVKEP